MRVISSSSISQRDRRGGRFVKQRKVFMRVRFAKALMGVLVLGISTASAGPLPAAQAVATPPQQGLRQPDVIYVPTRQTVVDAMLKVANVKAGDVLYDLGCGDGRIPVTAAKLGARAVCIDIDPRRIGSQPTSAKRPLYRSTCCRR
jgi:hypothetical protein